MATVSYTWVLDLAPRDNLQLSFVASASDTIAPSESSSEIVNQPVEDTLAPNDSFPLINSLSDALFFDEDASGIVRGPQTTVYITDERYIIRHDW